MIQRFLFCVGLYFELNWGGTRFNPDLDSRYYELSIYCPVIERLHQHTLYKSLLALKRVKKSRVNFLLEHFI